MKNITKKQFSSKIIFVTMLISIVSSMLISLISVGYNTRYLHQDSREHIKTMVKIAADSLDGDLLDTIGKDDMDSKLYQNVFDFLDGFRAAQDVKYIYTMRKVGDEVQFIVDVDDEDYAPVGEPFPTYTEIEQAFQGMVTVDQEVSNDVWGNYYSAFAPVRNRDGRIVAIVGIDCSLETVEHRIHSMKKSLFTLQLLFTLLMAGISVIAARAMSYYVTEATRDGLTGVFNRKYAMNYIDQKVKKTEHFSFLLMDIDYFKAINDNYGHRVGDQVLQALARILSENCRETDICFRLGGDEFAMFFNQKLTPNQLKDIAARMDQTFKLTLSTLCPDVHQAGISFGGLVGNGNVPFENMYHKADQLLYKVKNSGKGNCMVEKVN